METNNQLAVGTFKSEYEMRHFRRFLPVPLAEAAQHFWSDTPLAAKEGLTEYMLHREQFGYLTSMHSQRLIFQLLELGDTMLTDGAAENLMNLIGLASGAQGDELDDWLTQTTGVELA